MTNQCEFDSTLKLKEESKGLCFTQGNIYQEEILHVEFLKEFFLINIRLYNSALQMTFFMVTKIENRFMPNLKYSGKFIALSVGSVLPAVPNSENCLYMYFIAVTELQSPVSAGNNIFLIRGKI